MYLVDHNCSCYKIIVDKIIKRYKSGKWYLHCSLLICIVKTENVGTGRWAVSIVTAETGS